MAANLYRAAALVGIISTIGMGLVTFTSYLPPLAISLGIGVVIISLTAWAFDEESTPFERWLKKTCFGIERDEDDFYWTATEENLKKAMNEYYSVLMGLSAKLKREFKPTYFAGLGFGSVEVVLPGCSKDDSAWVVKIMACGEEVEDLLLARVSNDEKGKDKSNEHQIYATIKPNFNTFSTTKLSYMMKSLLNEFWEDKTLTVKGEFGLDSTQYNRAELRVMYWPDKDMKEESLELNDHISFKEES